MSKTLFSTAIIAVAMLSLFVGFELCGLSSSATADRGQSLRAPKTAVVDIQAITNDFLRNSGQLDALREKEGQQRNLLQILRGEIDAQKTNLEIYPEEDPKFVEAQMIIAIKSAEFKVRREALDITSNREKARLTAEIYEKAVQTIATYAQSKGLDMVFLKQDGGLKRLSLEEVSSNILVRAVIYNHPDLDITEEIKKLMK
ncbi:MAG: Skp family chaperone for outer membrane protein [Planctomycetota bacterium]|jgi:Skp family chaperone for outer membrane proteins